jgi:hypothetical protein
VVFRSVGNYLPTDTVSYSGGFRSTDFRIWDPLSGVYF